MSETKLFGEVELENDLMIDREIELIDNSNFDLQKKEIDYQSPEYFKNKLNQLARERLQRQSSANSNFEFVSVKNFILDHKYEPPVNQLNTLFQLEELLNQSSAGSSVSNEIRRKKSKSFRLKEEEMKLEYFKSKEPLKNYAPTRGQKVLPQNFRINLNGSASSPDLKKNPKKLLPKIYQELRVNEDIEEDRNLYKQKLKRSLNLSLNAIEPQKNPIDLIENSKKTYTEFCKYNLNRPIDLSNIESVLKQSIASNNSLKPKSNIEKKNPQNSGTESSIQVDAHTVTIKNLNDINMELKKRKSNLAKMSKYDNYINNLHNYHTHSQSLFKDTQINSKIKSILKSQQFSKNNNFDSNLDYYSIKSEEIIKNNSLPTSNPPIVLPASTEINSNKEIEHTTVNSSAQTSTQQQTSDDKYKLRIKQAREKILQDHYERINLNKMTILHPFEETKILINIDKAPTKLLNSLLNKQNVAPRYIIPPMRSFGYFKKVINLNQSNSQIINDTNNSNNSNNNNNNGIYNLYNQPSPRMENATELLNKSKVIQVPCAPQPTALDHKHPTDGSPGDYELNKISHQHRFESLASLNEEYRSALMRQNEFYSRSLKSFNLANSQNHHQFQRKNSDNSQNNPFTSHSLNNFNRINNELR